MEDKNQEVTVFNNSDFGQIRVITINEEPFFVAKDVADILEYSDTNKMTNRLDDDEKITAKLAGISKTNPIVTLITESGLYNAIIGSKKPEAKKFKKWITSEVLPSIRKHGFYGTDDWVESALTNPENMINILTKYKEEREKRLLAEKTVEIQKPKVEYFDALVERNLLSSLRITSKELKVPEKKFIGFLENQGYVYRDKHNKLQPYAQYVPFLFELKEWQTDKASGQQILITPKGRETFRLLTESLQK